MGCMCVAKDAISYDNDHFTESKYHRLAEKHLPRYLIIFRQHSRIRSLESTYGKEGTKHTTIL